MQEAFREHHGLQCGFCTPGMIMAAVDIVNRKGVQRSARTTSARSSKANLPLHGLPQHRRGGARRCRRHGRQASARPPNKPSGARASLSNRRSPNQQPSFAGSGRVSAQTSGRNVMTATGIGAPVRRKEDQRFITGKGQYTDDINRPGQAYAVFRALAARACRRSSASTPPRRCKRRAMMCTSSPVRTSPADKVGGLICGWMIHSKDGSPMKAGPHPALAQGKVRYVGDHVAVVIAETLTRRSDAAEKVASSTRRCRPSSITATHAEPRQAADPRRGAQQHGLQVAPRRQGGRPMPPSPAPSTSPRSTSSTIG